MMQLQTLPGMFPRDIMKQLRAMTLSSSELKRSMKRIMKFGAMCRKQANERGMVALELRQDLRFNCVRTNV